MISFTAEQRFIVTGASSGIGESVALLLNELGASVVGIGRNVDRLNGVRDKCKFPERMHVEVRDLAADIGALPQYVKALREKYGKFSGLAYCAGVKAVMPAKVYDLEYARSVFDINYFAPIFFAKGMIDRRNNIGPGCAMVFLSSLDALMSIKGQSLYSGSKAALSATIKGMAHESARLGIRMNCLLPSMIKTPMTKDEFLKSIGSVEKEGDSLYPFGWGEPKDVAAFVAFLLSNYGQHLSAQNYVIDSGGVY